MASLEKENGSIKLTAKEYKKLKAKLIEDYNYWIERCEHVASKCYQHLEENFNEYKDKSKSFFVKEYLAFDSHGNFSCKENARKDIYVNEQIQSNNFIKSLVNEVVKYAMYYEKGRGSLYARDYKVDISEEGAVFVKKALISEDDTGLYSIHKPNDKNFPKLTEKSDKIDFEYGTISFNDKDKTIVWNVEPAEMAIKQAWNTKTGISFNNALTGVEDWKESTGGIFYSTVDNETPKLSRYLGPIGQQEYKERISRMRASIKPR